MPVYAIYDYAVDLCGNEEITGPIQYVQAENKQEVREVFPESSFVGYIIKEIEIETVTWIKIQQQMLG